MQTARDMMGYRSTGATRRMAGLVLALGLHLLFFALLMAQRGATLAPSARADADAIVWIAPSVPRAAMTSPVLAAGRGLRPKTPKTPKTPVSPGVAMSAIAVLPAPAPAPARPPSMAPAGDVLSGRPGAETTPAPALNDLSAVDQRSVGAAIKATLAENAAPPHKNLIRARTLGRFEQFGADVQEASVPDCDKPDALKLDPPVIPGTRVALTGLLALPHLAHAALTGRCH